MGVYGKLVFLRWVQGLAECDTVKVKFFVRRQLDRKCKVEMMKETLGHDLMKSL